MLSRRTADCGHGAPVQTPNAIDTTRIARLAHEALLLEVTTFPKPGLVSHVDNGSHDDMTIDTFRASAAAIHPFMGRLAAAGSRAAPMNALRVIGIEAEAAMMDATGGVNTHRGAIFGLGLLCAAAGARAAGAAAGTLGSIVAARWGEAILGGPIPLHSHGSDVLRRTGAGGARHEAGAGFRTLYTVGLPALRDAMRRVPDDPEAARVHCLFALMERVQDTNLLHRGGPDGLAFAQSAARDFLADGGVGRPGWREAARVLHHRFVARRLSAGGCADLMAMTLFVHGMADDPPVATGAMR